MTAHCHLDPEDIYDRAAADVWAFLRNKPDLADTLKVHGIAYLLKLSFPPSVPARQDGGSLPVAAIPHPPHREGANPENWSDL